MVNISHGVTALVAACSLAQVANGLVISDGFAYAAGPLVGANGGTGWSGAWSSSVAVGSTGAIEVASGSIVFSDYATSGNRLSMAVSTTTSFLTSSASRAIGESASEGDLWVSFLYQRTDGLTSTTSRTAEVRFFDSAINFGSQIKAANSTGAAVRYDASLGSNATSPGNNLHDDSDPYLVISKYANLGTTGAAAAMWVLGVQGYDAIKSGGILESELDAVALVKAIDTTSTAEDLAIGELITIINATSSAPYSFSIDELRVGSSLDTVIPEPGGIIAAMAPIGLCRRRTSQQRSPSTSGRWRRNATSTATRS